MIVLHVIFALLVALLAIPVLVFSLQVLLSLGRSQAESAPRSRRPQLTVLIPAHNEGGGLAATLRSIKLQLGVDDQILVVADNCSDNTAAIAREYGATVIERQNLNKRGKGYALDFGVRYLERHTHPEVVVVVDADCQLHAGALGRLATMALKVSRPVQALYLMHAPAAAGLKTKIAEFAWTVKNHARALGYYRLGLPCQLMGTGMAFTWDQIRQADLASGHIVEDLKLGLDFAESGKAPLFCPDAVVTSTFPLNREGAQSQRTRWEHGHLSMIFKEALPLLVKSLATGNLSMLSLVLDMCVPPLALLTLIVAVLAGLGLVGMLMSGTLWPWMLAPFLLLLLAASVLLAWMYFGRHILSFGHLAYAPMYALAKIPLYLKFLVRRQVEWVRSRRD